MATYLKVEVIEVKAIYARKSKPDSRGISREFMVAHIICPAAEHRIEIKEGVEIPVGWSGEAVCSASPMNYINKFNNDSSTRFGYSPDLIMKFIPGKKIEFEDPFASSVPQKPVADSSRGTDQSK